MIITELKIPVTWHFYHMCSVFLSVKDTATWHCGTVGLGLPGKWQAVLAVQAYSPGAGRCTSHHRCVELGMQFSSRCTQHSRSPGFHPQYYSKQRTQRSVIGMEQTVLCRLVYVYSMIFTQDTFSNNPHYDIYHIAIINRVVPFLCCIHPKILVDVPNQKEDSFLYF